MPNESNIKNQVSIMDIDFINMTKSEFLHDHIYPRLSSEDKCFVVTANPEIVMRTRDEAAYKAIVEKADYVVPDGAGVVMASKMINKPLKERIPGFELTISLLEHAEAQGLSCYFLGAKEYVIEKMVPEVKKRYPNLKIAGQQHGFFALDDSSVTEEIIATKPDVVFVALGSPRQETWISKYIDQFSKGLFIGVGGSFDVLAGEVKRAPDKWIKYNLEWLYRLLKEPFRLKRFLKSIEFMIRMVLKRK
ncbi:glycosyltransferase [Virgibacillus profundi]|uniref:N-acetylglucosaminyldiphosphoundecaprenol N-acetyl-beta-D-mannosaminyltransferase n=1 Tax=Virgibacillus profundi TaxID=2024555 RepID=A0A2A2II53_9BACI|nr:WecB/TagA/CpsF family glycosyltransferase [Virgibacillus profundi]PAV31681.1 glycosyltransferase [Virgibacillus profundi]PXY55867.1 glycosyltransferase [Virgibacillus profundi]